MRTKVYMTKSGYLRILTTLRLKNNFTTISYKLEGFYNDYKRSIFSSYDFLLTKNLIFIGYL